MDYFLFNSIDKDISKVRTKQALINIKEPLNYVVLGVITFKFNFKPERWLLPKSFDSYFTANFNR